MARSPAPSPSRFRFNCSLELVELLSRWQATLLVSTYQAGKVLMVRSRQGRASTVIRNFDRPMGLATRSDGFAIATREQIWFLHDAPEIAARLKPFGLYDACFLPRRSHVTGDIRVHEIAWAGEELWIVNTRYSCLCTLDDRFSFVPRWRPPFITALEPEDRCHLNGLAVAGRAAKYVTMLGIANTPSGWREKKASGGCLIDVETGEIVTGGLSMPHSPRVYDGRLWILDSGTGRLLAVDARSGQTDTVAELPGYARGLTTLGPYALVGLSQVRETSTFQGLPVHRQHRPLRCGLWLVHWETGRVVPGLEFHHGVNEIFDVQILPRRRHPALVGLEQDAIRRLVVMPR